MINDKILDLGLYDDAKRINPIDTYLNDGVRLEDILGEEDLKKIYEDLEDSDDTLDGVIDYLNGIAYLNELQGNTKEQLKALKQLNKIERCINWNKGTPRPTTEQGYKNFIGNIGVTVETKRINEERQSDKYFNNEIAIILQAFLLGEYGELDPEDKKANDLAIENKNDIILGNYKTSKGYVYIYTESDRSRTTILFRDEY